MLATILISTISMPKPGSLEEPPSHLTSQAPISEDIHDSSFHISADEMKLRKILEENGVNIDLTDHKRRILLLCKSKSLPESSQFPSEALKVIHDYNPSLFGGINLSNIEKIILSMKEQQIDVFNINDEMLQEFITLSQALKIKSILDFNQGDQTQYVTHIYHERNEEILQHINNLQSILNRTDLNLEVKSEILINLLSICDNCRLPEDISQIIESFLQNLTHEQIISILYRNMKKNVELQLYILNRMSIDDFKQFIIHVNTINDISDELAQLISFHLGLHHNMIHFNMKDNLRHIPKFSIDNHNIRYTKYFSPHMSNEQKLLSLGIRNASYFNADELRKKIQIISDYSSTLHEKLNSGVVQDVLGLM